MRDMSGARADNRSFHSMSAHPIFGPLPSQCTEKVNAEGTSQRIALAEGAYSHTFALTIASRVPLPPSLAYSNAIRVKFLCRLNYCP